MVFKTTKDVKVPEQLIDQVIGQEEAVNIVKKVARQRRNLLLIGQPGTGKSLIGQALSSLLPKEKLVDVVSFHNFVDDNLPLIKSFSHGQGKDLVEKAKLQEISSSKFQNIFLFILLILAVISPWWIRSKYGDIMAAASLIGSMMFVVTLVLFFNLGKKARLGGDKNPVPKILIDNSTNKTVPFLDGTGAHAGALLGDVLHDPLQTFFPDLIVAKLIPGKQQLRQIKLNNLLDPLFERNKDELVRQGKHEAFFTQQNELFVLGDKKGDLGAVEVLSANRYPYTDKLVKITTESGKKLIVTPEHKVAVKKRGKKSWVEAFKLKKGSEVFVLD